jgi:hypothetical protein
MLKELDLENEFERKLLAEVIPPNELGVRFDDIGALDSVKDTLRVRAFEAGGVCCLWRGDIW